jgi:hypothetical protein
MFIAPFTMTTCAPPGLWMRRPKPNVKGPLSLSWNGLLSRFDSTARRRDQFINHKLQRSS